MNYQEQVKSKALSYVWDETNKIDLFVISAFDNKEFVKMSRETFERMNQIWINAIELSIHETIAAITSWQAEHQQTFQDNSVSQI